MNMKEKINQLKSKTLGAVVAGSFTSRAFAGTSPLPISTVEQSQAGTGILQEFQNILDSEVILFIVIFFAIVICIACLGGAYTAFKKFEDDEKLGKLIVSWIVAAVFFVLSGAFLYILYQIKSFTG